MSSEHWEFTTEFTSIVTEVSLLDLPCSVFIVQLTLPTGHTGKLFQVYKYKKFLTQGSIAPRKRPYP